jgi:hypothetical protein
MAHRQSMQLRLRDPEYTDRLASFLESLGQHPLVSGPNSVDIEDPDEDGQLELDIYLRVWRVLYPDAEIELAA